MDEEEEEEVDRQEVQPITADLRPPRPLIGSELLLPRV